MMNLIQKKINIYSKTIILIHIRDKEINKQELQKELGFTENERYTYDRNGNQTYKSKGIRFIS